MGVTSLCIRIVSYAHYSRWILTFEYSSGSVVTRRVTNASTSLLQAVMLQQLTEVNLKDKLSVFLPPSIGCSETLACVLWRDQAVNSAFSLRLCMVLAQGEMWNPQAACPLLQTESQRFLPCSQSCNKGWIREAACALCLWKKKLA